MNHITITDNGQRLLAKITAGETMAVFTRIGISDVQYTDEELQHLQVLEHVRRQADILNVEVKDDTTIVLSCYLNNQESEEGYYVSAVGIYAKAQGEEEILYGITSVENRHFVSVYAESGRQQKYNHKCRRDNISDGRGISCIQAAFRGRISQNGVSVV